MIDIDDIEGGEPAGEPAGDPAAGIAAAAVAGAALCLACGHKTAGLFCSSCGQKNDDLRRSSFVLAKDFVKDTFGFNSRMWRTLGLLAVAPGVVPTDYAHGRRSRYTPPVRLFLVVSFLFFLTLSLTETMFIALDVKQGAPNDGRGDSFGILTFSDTDADGFDCNLTAGLRFFVRPKDLLLDTDAWRRCYLNAEREISEAVKKPAENGKVLPDAAAEKAIGFVSGVLDGISTAVEDPKAFNADINTWLPRVMFLMTPVLALILALFIRGRNALMFDHLVMSLYSHAAGFAITGLAIVAAQFGLSAAFPVAAAAFAIYFLLALKRAYGRGWVKTVWTGLMSGFIYLLILLSIVMTIVVNTLVG